jgi:hypothetical protein
MSEKKNIGQILALLGNNGDGVALTLKTNAVQGVRNTIRHLNPIVRFVENHLRIDDYGLHLVQRGPGESYILRLALPEANEDTELPKGVQEFLEAFNRGAYPELELPAS